jgi:uncharacterized membrane protein
MADFPAPSTPASSPELPVTAGIACYALFAIAAVTALIGSGLVHFAPLAGIAGIVGVIVAYVKRGDARGSWLESHFSWLIRTFWWSLLWDLIAVVLWVLLAIVLVGFLIGPAILALTSIWVIYRVIRGYLAFKDNRPVG